MQKTLVVSVDQRLPLELSQETATLVSAEEFINIAETEGISGELYFNLDSLTKNIYDVLEGAGINVKYYIFADQRPTLDFKLSQKVTRYAVQPQTPAVQQPQVEEQPVAEQPIAQQVSAQPEVTQEPVANEVAALPGMAVATAVAPKEIQSAVSADRWAQLLNGENNELLTRDTSKPAKVILFGSSKGGTGKTFTCLLTAYRYAKTHPNERVALADFDIIDGQIGVTIGKRRPTLLEYYKQYKAGNGTFDYLENCHVSNEHFSSNIDFYLAPPMDLPEVTNDTAFWTNVFDNLIRNYDTVFFDTGIDYLGKKPISKLYKIADKILLTSSTNINAVSSVIKQIKALSGERTNDVFSREDRLLPRIQIILTRVSNNIHINNSVVSELTKTGAPIVAAFGNLDEPIARSQWYQTWEIWDEYEEILSYLDEIARLENE